MMVTFDICAGNPGALQFLMQAYDMDMFMLQNRGASRRRILAIHADTPQSAYRRDTRKKT